MAVLIGYLGTDLRGECGSMWCSVSVCEGKAGEWSRETSQQECSAPLKHTTRSNTYYRGRERDKERKIDRERERHGGGALLDVDPLAKYKSNKMSPSCDAVRSKSGAQSGAV